jgi:hypothetical protein
VPRSLPSRPRRWPYPARGKAARPLQRAPAPEVWGRRFYRCERRVRQRSCRSDRAASDLLDQRLCFGLRLDAQLVLPRRSAQKIASDASPDCHPRDSRNRQTALRSGFGCFQSYAEVVMSRKHVGLVVLTGIAIVLFSTSAKAEVYEVVCISNQTRDTVRYKIRYGSGPYTEQRLAAFRVWPWVQRAETAKPVTIWYDAELRRNRWAPREIPLRTRAANGSVNSCDIRHRYTFTVDPNDLNMLMLNDNGG